MSLCVDLGKTYDMKILYLLVLTLFIKVCCDSEKHSCKQEGCEALRETLQNLRHEFDKYKRTMTKEIKDIKCLVYDTPCPPNFTLVGHSCYRLVRKSMKKQTAANRCKKMCDSHLVTITKEKERDRLVSFIENQKRYPDEIYTSGVTSKSLLPQGKGTLRWIWGNRRRKTVNLVDNHLWQAPIGSPQKNMIAECVIMKRHSTGKWFVRAAYCNHKSAFVCELVKCSLKRGRC